MRFRETFSVVCLSCCFAASVSAQDAFVPEKHFPEQSLLYLTLDGASLERQMEDTLLGAIFRHPAWEHQVLASYVKLLRAQFEPVDAQIRAVTGKTYKELNELLTGKISLTLKTFIPPTLVEAALAIDGGERVEEVIEVIDRLSKLYVLQTGKPIETRTVGDIEARVWSLPVGGPLFQVRMGTHVLFVSSADLLRTIHSAYKGGDIDSLDESDFYKEVDDALAVANRSFMLAVNLKALRGLVLPLIAMAGDDVAEVRQIIKVTGAGHLTSLGFAIGGADGAMEGAAHLGSSGGARGALEAVASIFEPVQGVDGALKRMPASASSVSALRVAPGTMLKNVDRLVRRLIPEIAADLDGGFEAVEQNVGLSVRDDLFALSGITVYSYSAKPPAGGLLDDTVYLVKDDELSPYWKLYEKLTARAEAIEKTIDVPGGKVRYHTLAPRAGPEDMLKIIGREGFPLYSGAELATMAFLAAPAQVSRLDLGGGWVALAGATQPLIRYAHYHAKGDKFADGGELASLAREKLEGSSFATVFRSGGGSLYFYNTLVSLIAPLSSVLQVVGIDAAAIPPGEYFLDYVGSGWVQFNSDGEGFTLRGRRALFSSGTLVGVGVVAIVAGLVVPSLMNAQSSAYSLQCMSNLRGLQQAAMQYAIKEGAFPHDSAGSEATFDLLRKEFPDLDAENFVCPEGGAITSDEGEALSEETCDYMFAPWPLKSDDRAMLIWEKGLFHGKSRMVITTLGRALELSELEFRQRFAEERRKFSKKK